MLGPATKTWSVAGNPLGWETSHHPANYSIQAALVKDVDNWRCLFPDVVDPGGRTHSRFCLPCVPGILEWPDEDVLIRIMQRTENGTNHQVCKEAESTNLFMTNSLQCVLVGMLDNGSVMPMPHPLVCMNTSNVDLVSNSPLTCNNMAPVCYLNGVGKENLCGFWRVGVILMGILLW